MTRHDVLIVGGGHAGAQAAIALRQAKFAGSIAIVGDEPDPPYERPPLSKEYLSGDKPFERLLLRQPAFWAERAVTLRLGERVVAVDPDMREVRLAGGDRLGYGDLIWAAGGDARRLPCAGGNLIGVHTMRTRADADRLMAELPAVTRAVVIGGGYIGLEAAAVLAKRGVAVTLVETLPRVLARVAGEPLSRFFEAEHRAHGVDVRLGATVDRIEGADGRVAGVHLVGGERLACEVVIVGIGIVPATQPLTAAGAEGENGVLVDARCRTTLPHIFAVGDCALHPNRFADNALVRLESVQNANDQASVAAKTIAGQDVTYDAVPWFWSNQYDLRLQTVGLSGGHDQMILRGDPATRSFSVVYLKEGGVVALDCVNATRDYVQGRKLVVDRARIASERLADVNVELKALATSA